MHSFCTEAHISLYPGMYVFLKIRKLVTEQQRLQIHMVAICTGILQHVRTTSISHLISWWVQRKQLRVSVSLPCLLVEAVQLLMAAESQQPLHSLVWS